MPRAHYKNKNADFRKTKAKVGRKVEASSVTKINVKSKRIHMPIQTFNKTSSEGRAYLDGVLKQLRHHASSTRLAAVNQLQSFFSNVDHAAGHSLLALVVPNALEVLFDEDEAVRKQLLVLLKALINGFPSTSFASIASIYVTYVCSGLTNLVQTVKVDALRAAHMLIKRHAHLLRQHSGRLMAHILLLLNNDKGWNIDKLASESRKEAGKAGRGGKGKNCSSNDISSLTAVSTGESKGKTQSQSSKVKATKSGKLDRFSLVMDMISELLSADLNFSSSSTAMLSTSGDHSTSSSSSSNVFIILHHRPMTASVLTLHANTNTHGKKMLTANKMSNSRIENSQTSSSSSRLGSDSSTRSITESSFADAVLGVCLKLSSIWSSLDTDEGQLDVGKLQMLQSIVRVSHKLAEYVNTRVIAVGGVGLSLGREKEYEAFLRLTQSILKHFPYSLKDADRFIYKSDDEAYACRSVYIINLLIAELGFMIHAVTSTLSEERQDIGNNDIDNWVNKIQLQCGDSLLSAYSETLVLLKQTHSTNQISFTSGNGIDVTTDIDFNSNSSADIMTVKKAYDNEVQNPRDRVLELFDTTIRIFNVQNRTQNIHSKKITISMNALHILSRNLLSYLYDILNSFNVEDSDDKHGCGSSNGSTDADVVIKLKSKTITSDIRVLLHPTITCILAIAELYSRKVTIAVDAHGQEGIDWMCFNTALVECLSCAIRVVYRNGAIYAMEPLINSLHIFFCRFASFQSDMRSSTDDNSNNCHEMSVKICGLAHEVLKLLENTFNTCTVKLRSLMINLWYYTVISLKDTDAAAAEISMRLCLGTGPFTEIYERIVTRKKENDIVLSTINSTIDPNMDMNME
jgi:hypothetical protein